MRITAWRIVQSRHLHGAFSGEGARLYPGRWNERGTPMVYTAGSLSLAAMEMLVHLGRAALLKPYMSSPVTFDDTLCHRPAPTDLPTDWADSPAPASTRALGTAWVDAGTSAVLAVPSAVVPIEAVFLLNPRHPDFAKVSIGDPGAFRFDPRLGTEEA